jgi:hypothetical protein
MKMPARAAFALSVLLACTPAAAQSLDQSGGVNSFKGAAITGTLSAAGASASVKVRGDFNFSLWGTFAATCELDRSFDSGTTWIQLTAIGSPFSWTAPATEVLNEPESGILYRVNCTAVSSGTVNYRVSQ